jgi:hypothetical protein
MEKRGRICVMVKNGEDHLKRQRGSPLSTKEALEIGMIFRKEGSCRLLFDEKEAKEVFRQ